MTKVEVKAKSGLGSLKYFDHLNHLLLGARDAHRGEAVPLHLERKHFVSIVSTLLSLFEIIHIEILLDLQKSTHHTVHPVHEKR